MKKTTLLQRVWGPSYADERNYLRTFVQRGASWRTTLVSPP